MKQKLLNLSIASLAFTCVASGIAMFTFNMAFSLIFAGSFIVMCFINDLNK